MKYTSPTLAASIRRARTRQNLTQTQFACRLGIKQQKLSEWERGKRLGPVLAALPLVKLLGKMP